MNVLLIAADSMIPNLAMMKISAHHKSQGDTVGWDIPDPDIIYTSTIFTKNAWKAASGAALSPNADIISGGPGYDPTVTLGDMERLPPDYTIYPDYHDSLGRVTIGCHRKCHFCLVPKMGSPRFIQHPKDFYQGGVCRIIDDNLQMFDAYMDLDDDQSQKVESKLKEMFRDQVEELEFTYQGDDYEIQIEY